MSKIGKLNYYLFQLFFFRIGKRIDDSDQVVGYSLLFPILPFTGWNGPYVPNKFINLRILSNKN